MVGVALNLYESLLEGEGYCNHTKILQLLWMILLGTMSSNQIRDSSYQGNDDVLGD